MTIKQAVDLLLYMYKKYDINEIVINLNGKIINSKEYKVETTDDGFIFYFPNEIDGNLNDENILKCFAMLLLETNYLNRDSEIISTTKTHNNEKFLDMFYLLV